MAKLISLIVVPNLRPAKQMHHAKYIILYGQEILRHAEITPDKERAAFFHNFAFTVIICSLILTAILC